MGSRAPAVDPPLGGRPRVAGPDDHAEGARRRAHDGRGRAVPLRAAGRPAVLLAVWMESGRSEVDPQDSRQAGPASARVADDLAAAGINRRAGQPAVVGCGAAATTLSRAFGVRRSAFWVLGFWVWVLGSRFSVLGSAERV